MAKVKNIKLADGTLLDLDSGDNLKYSNITNCLLEIPQRIKYTLENGTLTIKAGSVVIVPYGTEDLSSTYPVGATFLNDNFKVYNTQYADGKFFVWAELVGDIITSGTTADTDSRLLFMDILNNKTTAFKYSGSGTTDYTGTTSYVLYRTDTNVIKHYSGGTLTEKVHSLPLGVVIADGTNYYGSIDQVFNGMGYIGSTIWLDKDVKGLIPNSRNEDGSLKNIETITNQIYTLTETVTRTNMKGMLYTYKISNTSQEVIVKDDNILYIADIPHEALVFATFDRNAGVISNFNPKQPFRAVDYNDKSEISGWGMPSDEFIDLTLGATGSSYTAPVNGWVYLSRKSTAAGQYISIATKIGTRVFAQSSNQLLQTFIPIKKGSQFSVAYTAPTENVFRFIYAEGEV